MREPSILVGFDESLTWHFSALCDHITGTLYVDDRGMPAEALAIYCMSCYKRG